MSEHNPFQAFGTVDAAILTRGTGLEFLKSMLDRSHPSPPFRETTDIWLVSAETGRVRFEAMPSARFYNPMGVVHGGWIATLLDSCMGCTVHSRIVQKPDHLRFGRFSGETPATSEASRFRR